MAMISAYANPPAFKVTPSGGTSHCAWDGWTFRLPAPAFDGITGPRVFLLRLHLFGFRIFKLGPQERVAIPFLHFSLCTHPSKGSL